MTTWKRNGSTCLDRLTVGYSLSDTIYKDIFPIFLTFSRSHIICTSVLNIQHRSMLKEIKEKISKKKYKKEEIRATARFGQNLISPNRPRSINQYSNMVAGLWGQNCKFFEFLLSLNPQTRLGYKENSTKYRSLSWKPRSHVRILIYRRWLIRLRHCQAIL